MESNGILFSDNIDDLLFLRNTLYEDVIFASDSNILSKILREKENSRLFIKSSLVTEKIKSLAAETCCTLLEFQDTPQLLKICQEIKDFLKQSQETVGSSTNLSLHSSLYKISPTFSFLIGKSAAMQRLRSEIIKASKLNLSVLLLGETGTGKTTVAKAIHELSERRNMPFKTEVLSNSNENLIESKLFGVARGAFTGAVEKAGTIEEANGGTLFLDEIGEITSLIQTKLLQVLSEGIIIRVGSNKEIHIDARMIFATNASLERKIKEGTFREDLLYRINDVTITLPPLRERLEDIPELCTAFLKRENIQKHISDSAISLLQTLPWKGNIRQLEKVLLRAALFYSENDEIRPGDIRI